jgi:hypothetical protein
MDVVLALFARGLGGRDVALQRILVIPIILAGVVQVPGIARMAKVAFLLGSPGVFRPGHAVGGAKEKCAPERGCERKNFNEPTHGPQVSLANIGEFGAYQIPRGPRDKGRALPQKGTSCLAAYRPRITDSVGRGRPRVEPSPRTLVWPGRTSDPGESSRRHQNQHIARIRLVRAPETWLPRRLLHFSTRSGRGTECPAVNA